MNRIASLLSIISLALLVAPAAGGARAPEVAGSEHGNYEHCVDTLFTRPELSLRFGLTKELVVTIRANDCDIERQVTLFQNADGRIGALILHAEGMPIYEQLEILERKSERKPFSFARACEQVKVSSSTKSAKEVPALVGLIAELKTMEFSPVLEPLLYVHAAWYHVWITSVTNKSYFEFNLPSPPGDDDLKRLPIAGWCQKVFSTLAVTCDDLENREK